MKLFRILFRIYLEYDWTKNLIFRVQISPQSNNIQISGISAITLELDHQKSWFLCWNYSIDHLYLLPTFFWFYFNTKVKGFAQLGYYDAFEPNYLWPALELKETHLGELIFGHEEWARYGMNPGKSNALTRMFAHEGIQFILNNLRLNA